MTHAEALILPGARVAHDKINCPGRLVFLEPFDDSHVESKSIRSGGDVRTRVIALYRCARCGHIVSIAHKTSVDHSEPDGELLNSYHPSPRGLVAALAEHFQVPEAPQRREDAGA